MFRGWTIPLLLIVLLTVAGRAQELHGIGSEFKVECSAQPTELYFKLMKRFVLVLQPYVQEKVEATLQAKGSAQCTMTNASPICDFEGAQTQLFIKCTKSVEIALYVARPQMLGTSKLTSRFVELSDANFSRGVVSVLVENDLQSQVRLSYNSPDIGQQIFSVSPCVKSIALFEDHFRIAVQRDHSTCVIGLKRNIDARWSFRSSPSSVSLSTQHFEDFCKEGGMRTYSLPESSNYTVEILVETDVDQVLNGLKLAVVFHRRDKPDFVFSVSNYQKGIDPFSAKLHYDQPADSFTVSSNLGVFFLFSFESTQQSYLGLEEDEYMYTTFRKNFAFTLELDNFDTQNVSQKAVQVFASPEAPQNLKLQFAECVDFECTNAGSFEPIANGKFIPKCLNLTEQFCVVKIGIAESEEKEYGLVAHVLMDHEEIDANRYHHGTLNKDAINKYVLKKEALDMASDQFVVMAEGVHVYLTYDPECRRISCCQYDIRSGYKEVPNQRKDLYVFLQGTSRIKYHFLFDLKDNSSFVLNDGLLVRSEIGVNDTYKYFTYQIKDPSKGLEINCNAPAGAVELLLSKDKTFDDTIDNTFRSKYCYIYLPPNSTQAGTNIHISLKRIQKHLGRLQFTIVAVPEGGQVQLDFGTPYYDYLHKKATKLFVFHVEWASVEESGLAFKVDIPESLKGDHHVSINFGNGIKNALSLVEWDLRTIMLPRQTLKEICDSKDLTKLCKVIVAIQNLGDIPLELDILVWVRYHPVMLYDGHFINFDTGALEDETHFYFDIVDKDKPINIYVSSTQVEVEVKWIMYVPEEDQTFTDWPYPNFPRYATALEADSQPKQPTSFTFSNFIDPKLIQSNIEEGKRLVVLMTVRDQSRKINKDSVFKDGQYTSSVGSIQLIYSTGQVELREDDKFEYYLMRGDSMYLIYDLSGILSLNSSKQQIQLYNTKIMGMGLLEIQWYLTEDNMQAGQEKKVDTTSSEVVTVTVDEIKKLVKAINLVKSYRLVFLIRSVSFIGRHICNLVTTYSEYRELTLGVPEEFRIKPNASAIFEFADAYNKEFKIKINRREGFPDYKIISCSAIENFNECFKQLDRKDMAETDPTRIVVGGRSHELEINSKSEVYCKQCRYYIAFYAEEEEVEGSLTVIRSNQTIVLVEGRTLTTEVYGASSDMYRVGVTPTKPTAVRVSAYTGQITVTVLAEVPVELEQQFQLGETTRLEVVEEVNVDINKSAQLTLRAQYNENLTDESPYDFRTIVVKSKDGSTPAMYTIFYASQSFPVALEDGMPIHIGRQGSENLSNNFQFAASAKATLIVMSATKLTINLQCPEKQKSTQLNTASGAQQGNLESDVVNHIEHSLIWNITSVVLDPEVCKRYMIRVEGSKKVDYNIVVSGHDIVFLPLDQMLPGRLLRGQTRIYEVPIAQSTHLKISMRLCTKGQVTVGLTYDKADLKTKDFDSSFEISMEQDYQTYSHKARPGILYIVVQSVNKDIDYTLEVFNFRGKQVDDTLVYLEDSSIHHSFIGVLAAATDSNESISTKAKSAVSKIMEAGKEFSYELEFTPVKIESAYRKYFVAYLIVESRTKQTLESLVRCRGMYFGDSSSEVGKIISRELITLTEQQSNTTQKVKYQSQFESSYISIIPIANPNLPAHITYETYKIVRLSGPSSNPFVMAYHLVSSIYGFLQSHSPFQNTWHLYLLTIAIVLLSVTIIFIIVSAIIGCIVYQVQTHSYRKRSRLLPQSEFDLRQHQSANDTNLDMTERTTTSATLSLPEGEAPSQLV